jgi:hypothetical protein
MSKVVFVIFINNLEYHVKTGEHITVLVDMRKGKKTAHFRIKNLCLPTIITDIPLDVYFGVCKDSLLIFIYIFI